jgi:hypothetical protein
MDGSDMIRGSVGKGHRTADVGGGGISYDSWFHACLML